MTKVENLHYEVRPHGGNTARPSVTDVTSERGRDGY